MKQKNKDKKKKQSKKSKNYQVDAFSLNIFCKHLFKQEEDTINEQQENEKKDVQQEHNESFTAYEMVQFITKFCKNINSCFYNQIDDNKIQVEQLQHVDRAVRYLY